jgi:hypothetical protein
MIVEHQHGRPAKAFGQTVRDSIQGLHLALQEHRARHKSSEEKGLHQSLIRIVRLGGITDVWRKHKEEILDPLNKDIYVSVKHQKVPGHPRKVSVAELHARVKAVPFHFCKNVSTLSFKIGIPTTTLHRALKLGLLKLSKNSIMPILMPKNKLDRLAYCHSFVQENSFVDMLDCVDINEKWFYLSQVVTSFIFVPGEVPPLCLCKHKSHIEKAMCLTTMARPRQDPVTGVWWDGKLGTWFFVE